MRTLHALPASVAVKSMLSAVLLVFASGCARNPNVITQHNDSARSGETVVETSLKPSNVNALNFGMLYDRNVNGGVFAQPLYVHGVATESNGTKNLFFIATETNWVYAFDADDVNPDPNAGRIFGRQLEPTGPVAICDETPSHIVGITSTPVIDDSSGTMYVVARNAENHEYYLHALDITNGLNDKRAPVQISATDPNGVQFNAECERNRPGLLLLNGIVYIAFATFTCDANCPGNVPYHGWVLGYRTSDLAQVGVFCTSPESGGAGIWQSGNGLVGAGQNTIYFETGNGPGPLGDSFVMLQAVSSPPGLQPVHSFHPANAATLNLGDTDLGSGGPIWVPPGFLIGGGKQGRYYVLDAGTMNLTQDPSPTPPGNFDGFQAFTNSYHGDSSKAACRDLPPAAGCDPHYALDPSGALVYFPQCYISASRYQNGELCGPNIHAGPVFWSLANSEYGLIYQMAEKDYLKAFRYDKSTHHVDESPFLTAGVRPVDGMPGGFSSLSANFDHDAILWTSIPLGDGQWQNVQSRLAAFNAATLQELWHHDGGYLFAKFTPPTIADGKVIRATFSNKVVVYGLRVLPWWQRWIEYVFRKKFPPPPPERVDQEAVEEKYELVGGKSGLVGSPTGDPQALRDPAGGWYRDFRGVVIGSVDSTVSMKRDPSAKMPRCGDPPRPGSGTRVESSIYWSRRTGAHVVTGEIREFWLKLGGPKSQLGYPVSDEEPSLDGLGRISRFEHGQILWSPEKGSYVPSEGGASAALLVR